MIITTLSVNILAYYGTRPFIQNSIKYDLTTSLDKLIPLRTEWIIIYVLAYLQWAIGFIVAARERKSICYKFFSAEMLAKFICLICFLVIPVTIQRPEITGDAPWDYLTRLIYTIDAPESLCPSIHCLESYACFRGALLSEKMPKWYAWATGGFALLVFASTVLVKQHFIIDVFAGIIVTEICFQISHFIMNKKGHHEKSN